MNNKKIFEEIYNDFFGNESLINKEDNAKTDINIDELTNRINNLRVTDESKELLTKIIKYMYGYNKQEQITYLNFSLIINSPDVLTTDDVINILKESIASFNYLPKSDLKEISLLHYNKSIDINDIYEKYNIIVFKNLNGYEYLSDVDKKKLSTDILNNNKNTKSLSILSGTNDEIHEFLLSNPNLKDYFSFVIDYQKPDIQDIYQLVLNEVTIKEDDQPKLLDYITNSINNVTDFDNYKNNLIKEITFYERIPQIESPKTLDEIFKDLNELVGLKKVKKVLYELADLLELKDKAKDLKISNVNLHMVFLGNPGTGKTTVARIIANILYNLKYIKTNNLIEVSSKA